MICASNVHRRRWCNTCWTGHLLILSTCAEQGCAIESAYNESGSLSLNGMWFDFFSTFIVKLWLLWCATATVTYYFGNNHVVAGFLSTPEYRNWTRVFNMIKILILILAACKNGIETKTLFINDAQTSPVVSFSTNIRAMPIKR